MRLLQLAGSLDKNDTKLKQNCKEQTLRLLKLLPKKDIQDVAKDINIQLTDEDLVTLGL